MSKKLINYRQFFGLWRRSLRRGISSSCRAHGGRGETVGMNDIFQKGDDWDGKINYF